LFLDELAAYYDVSLTPIRHALRRLEGEGFVVTVPRRGSQVAPLTFDELEEIVTIRLGVEPLLARLGAERCTDETAATLQRRLADPGLTSAEAGERFEARARIRDICYRCADRPHLLKIVRHQRLRSERYLLSLLGSGDALAGSERHHVTLVDACRTRDGELAESATREALAWALTQTGRLLDEERAKEWDWLLRA
jgi:DNA-binding GntR family transcriptional regulator